MNLIELNGNRIKDFRSALLGSPHWTCIYVTDDGSAFSHIHHPTGNTSIYRNKISRDEVMECYNLHRDLHREEGNYFELDLSNDYDYDKVRNFEIFFRIIPDNYYRNEPISDDKKEEIINDFKSKVNTIIVLRKKYNNEELKLLLNTSKLVKYKHNGYLFCNNPCSSNNCGEDTYYYNFINQEELSNFLKSKNLNIKIITTMKKEETKSGINIDIKGDSKAPILVGTTGTITTGKNSPITVKKNKTINWIVNHKKESIAIVFGAAIIAAGIWDLIKVFINNI